MISWEMIAGVVGLILTLLSIFAFFVRPIVKLNTSITTLSDAVKGLLKAIDKNDESHKEFREQLGDHETRITVMEKTSNK